MLRTLLVAAILAVAAWVFLPHIFPLFQGGQAEAQVDPSASEALRQLSELEVAPAGGFGEAPPYSRDQFGEGWADLDGDGCNTRNEVLSRDLNSVIYNSGTGDCVVESGILEDPYTGQTVDFLRGEQTSALVQIDHVVALADAWASGAWQWEAGQRLEFANDPENLLAVDGSANQEKGASTADVWLPRNEGVWCGYAERQVAVKYKWSLSVTRPELETLNRVLSDCAKDRN